MQCQAKLGTRHRIDRHQGRMRKALVEIFDDDARVIDHQLAIDQRRQLQFGVDVDQIFGDAPRRDLYDFDVYAFLAQHDARAMAVRIGR